MPKLELKMLHCIETEDNHGADHAYITIDDNKIWGPVRINDGEDQNVGYTHEFVHRATVRLYDYDSSSGDDYLGMLQATANDANGVEQTAYFTEDDASYRLNYVVSMNPGKEAIRVARNKPK
jgi:hypothetical protein